MKRIKIVFEFDIPDDECPVEAANRMIYAIFEDGDSVEDYAQIEVTTTPS